MRKVSSVRRPGRKTLFVCIALAFLLVSVLSTILAPNSSSNGVELSVAAQTQAASNKTVRNNVSVLSDSVSLGSSLHVEGIVSSPSGPWDSVTVALHMGDITLAHTQTNASGAYVFSVPIDRNNVPAVLSGSVSVYTVAQADDPAVPAVSSAVVLLPVNATAEPSNPAVPAVSSAVVLPPVNSILAYGVVGGVVGIAVLGLYVFTRAGTKGALHIRPRFAVLRERLSSLTRGGDRVNIGPCFAATRQRFSSFTKGIRNIISLAALRQQLSSLTRVASRRQQGAEAPLQSAPISELGLPVGVGSNADESTDDLLSQAPTEAQLRLDDSMAVAAEQTEAAPQLAPAPETELALETARDLFEQGKSQPAASVLYAATVTCLAKVHGVTLAPSMTHREKYAALQRAAPDIRKPLRTLTVAYERTTYAGEALTKEQQDTAIEACKSVCKHIGRADNM